MSVRRCSRNAAGVAGLATHADREFLDLLVDGDLADQFQAALDTVSAADPLAGGGPQAGNND